MGGGHGAAAGFVPLSASVEEVARTSIWDFGAPPLPRGSGVTLHRAPYGVASPPHADSPAGEFLSFASLGQASTSPPAVQPWGPLCFLAALSLLSVQPLRFS